MGGGGGGALGAPVGGMGGGGGGADGAPEPMGGEATGEETVGELTGGVEVEADLLSAADRGRGGAMVPKRMEASWAALLPPPRPSSESSSLESLSWSVPQSSSCSWGFLEIGPEGTVDVPRAEPTALAAVPAALVTA